MGRLHYVFISLGDADILHISCKKHFKAPHVREAAPYRYRTPEGAEKLDLQYTDLRSRYLADEWI